MGAAGAVLAGVLLSLVLLEPLEVEEESAEAAGADSLFSLLDRLRPPEDDL